MKTLGSLSVLLPAVFVLLQQARVEEVARLPSFTEAPVFDNAGNLFVSETFGANISRISQNGDVTTWASTGNPNGHKVLDDGTHLVCDGKQAAVLRLDSDGVILPGAVTTCDDHAVQEPNDLVLDSFGGFYFTDTGPLPEALGASIGKICYVDKNGEARLVVDELPAPNGIVLANGERLLVSLSGASQIVEFPVVRAGVVGAMRVFADRGSDGMALDTDGNLYVTGREDGKGYVGVVDDTGALIAKHVLPIGFVSNMVFGGSDLDELWVTGQQTVVPGVPMLEQVGPESGNQGVVYRLKLNGVRGLDPRPWRR